MKRQYLEELGLEKEVIDKIMEEQGKTIEENKRLKSELETVKEQLQEANTTIDGFKDYDDIKLQVSEYQTKLENSQKEYESKIADMEFKNELSEILSNSKVRDEKSVMAHLDLDALKGSNNRKEDIKSALEQIKAEKDFLFVSDEPLKNPVRETKNSISITDDHEAKLRAVMGLKPKE